MASTQARRRSGGPGVHPHRARSGLPPGRRRGARAVTLRVRLLAALAYVLLLAVVALGVPLAINLGARVRAEVRTQAQAQADLVAATAEDFLVPPRRREL